MCVEPIKDPIERVTTLTYLIAINHLRGRRYVSLIKPIERCRFDNKLNWYVLIMADKTITSHFIAKILHVVFMDPACCY